MKPKKSSWPFLLFSMVVILIVATGIPKSEGYYTLPLLISLACLVYFLYEQSHIVIEKKELEDAQKKLDLVESKDDSGVILRKVLEILPSPYVIVDSKGQVTFANFASYDLLPHINVGTHISALLRSPNFLTAVEDSITWKKEISLSFEVLLPHYKYLETDILPLPEDSFHEITDSIIIRINDKSMDIQIEQMRKDFISNASHELRTPLASIIGFIETIRGHAKEDPNTRELFLGLMEKQAQRMQLLVDDLLSLSKLELQEKSQPISECHLYDVIEELANSLQPIAKKYDVKLINKVRDTIPIINGDFVQLQQLYSNLIENAIKYSGKNKTVTIKEIKSDQPGTLGIAVCDNGNGIAPEHVYRLTERFYRVNAEYSREVQGTGLGLSIVKHILNRHNGKLTIESTLGKGSSFITSLPISVNHRYSKNSDAA